MKVFRIVCRGSKLSLAQADIFKQKLATTHSNIQVEIVVKETEGDINQTQPLTELEGKDFFTKDIQDFLMSGQADFAVHSLKDVSGENFFKDNTYAIIERDDVHDVGIFAQDVMAKLGEGKTLKIGTSSPRRVEMAIDFLSKVMPMINGHHIQLEASMIRGNVDTRLRKLDSGEYDGIILACAGLNRLLRSSISNQEVKSLLSNKKLMILPLLECPPAPGQGAIVAETSPDNDEAIRILQSINIEPLARAVSKERVLAHQYGSGCHQKFGVVHISAGNTSFTYAAGKDRNDKLFSETLPKETALKSIGNPLTDGEKNLIEDQQISLFTSVESIAKRKGQIQHVWVSKTDLWFDLAHQGVWVQGSFEGFGWKFIEGTVKSTLVKQCNMN